MFHAYKQGRSDKNPAEFWHQGEIGFLDYYVIPLAKKLETCGVFGVSSAEYLQYATNNRNEWVAKGEQAVKEMVASAEQEYATLEAVEEDPVLAENDMSGAEDKVSYNV